MWINKALMYKIFSSPPPFYFLRKDAIGNRFLSEYQPGLQCFDVVLASAVRQVIWQGVKITEVNKSQSLILTLTCANLQASDVQICFLSCAIMPCLFRGVLQLVHYVNDYVCNYVSFSSEILTSLFSHRLRPIFQSCVSISECSRLAKERFSTISIFSQLVK